MSEELRRRIANINSRIEADLGSSTISPTLGVSCGFMRTEGCILGVGCSCVQDETLSIEKLRGMMYRLPPALKPVKILVGCPYVDGVARLPHQNCDWWLIDRISFARMTAQRERYAPIGELDLLSYGPGTFNGAQVFFWQDAPEPLQREVSGMLEAIAGGLVLLAAQFLFGGGLP